MRYYILIFFSFWSAVFCTSQSYAANCPITFSQTRTLNFGTVTKQTGIDVSATVGASSAGRGQILIQDSVSSGTIKITVQSCGLTADNVRIKDFTMLYGAVNWSVSGDGPFTRTGLANPANSGTQLRTGATILVTKDATTAALTPCYTITVQHDSTPPSCTSVPVVFNQIGNVLVVGAPMLLNDINTMNFGPVTQPTINSTIVMQPSGTMNVATGNAILVNGNSGTAGQFTLTAEKNDGITISIPNGAVSGGLGLSNMTVSLNSGVTTNVATSQNFTTNATGSNNLKVGGTLTVQTSVTNGSKTVPYTMTINYQ